MGLHRHFGYRLGEVGVRQDGRGVGGSGGCGKASREDEERGFFLSLLMCGAHKRRTWRTLAIQHD
jgi:hypothetical protein